MDMFPMINDERILERQGQLVHAIAKYLGDWWAYQHGFGAYWRDYVAGNPVTVNGINAFVKERNPHGRDFPLYAHKSNWTGAILDPHWVESLTLHVTGKCWNPTGNWVCRWGVTDNEWVDIKIDILSSGDATIGTIEFIADEYGGMAHFRVEGDVASPVLKVVRELMVKANVNDGIIEELCGKEN